MLVMSSRAAVFRWSALIVGLPIAALSLVVLADLIPDRFVAYRLRDAIVVGQLDERSYDVGFTGGQVDGYSECKRLTIGLGVDPGVGTFESAVRSSTLGPCETAVPKLLGWANGEGLTGGYDYFRYWNGSTVALRPSVAAVGLPGTRILAALALVIAAGAWVWRAGRRIGTGPALLTLAPLALTTDAIDLPGALVQAIGMIVALGAAAALLWFLSADATRGTYGAAAFACGAAFQFFGDLTNPDAAWALVVASAAVLAVGSMSVAGAVWRTGAAAVGWIAGFAWLWLTKWMVAALVVGYDTVRFVVTEKAEERLSGAVDGTDASVFSGLSAAWGAWRDQPLTTLVVVGLGATAVVAAVRRGDLRASWAPRLVLAGAAAIPVVWHLVLRNHTSVHFWFTYRSFAVAFGILLMALTARIGRVGVAGVEVSVEGSEGDRVSRSEEDGISRSDDPTPDRVQAR